MKMLELKNKKGTYNYYLFYCQWLCMIILMALKLLVHIKVKRRVNLLRQHILDSF